MNLLKPLFCRYTQGKRLSLTYLKTRYKVQGTSVGQVYAPTSASQVLLSLNSLKQSQTKYSADIANKYLNDIKGFFIYKFKATKLNFYFLIYIALVVSWKKIRYLS